MAKGTYIKRSLQALAVAGLIAAIAAPQAITQGIVGVFQNGLPGSPSLYGFGDSASGLYFATGRLGLGAKHVEAAAQSVPVLSACGGAVAGDAGSSDTAGTVTQGGTVTTCTITFGTAFNATPMCIVSDLTGTRASMASTATTTAITVTGITASDKLAWFCIGKQGG